MAETRPPYSLKAPGASDRASSLQLPGRDLWPGLDDRLVEPEVSRDEVIGGRRMVAQPAKRPHGKQHFVVSYVLGAHLAPGYSAAVDQLTRYDFESDFASDACVFRDDEDPEAESRSLEEIAFEVVSKQSQKVVTEKAVRMHRRGVRRIFAVFLKGRRRVCEWAPQTQSWVTLDPEARIEDPCLAVPLQVSALLEAATAEKTVVAALIAKGNPQLQSREAAARSEGAARGKAEAILAVLESRGLAVGKAQREWILGCGDLARLDRWSRRAALVVSTDELLQDP